MMDLRADLEPGTIEGMPRIFYIEIYFCSTFEIKIDIKKARTTFSSTRIRIFKRIHHPSRIERDIADLRFEILDKSEKI